MDGSSTLCRWFAHAGHRSKVDDSEADVVKQVQVVALQTGEFAQQPLVQLTVTTGGTTPTGSVEGGDLMCHPHLSGPSLKPGQRYWRCEHSVHVVGVRSVGSDQLGLGGIGEIGESSLTNSTTMADTTKSTRTCPAQA